jgi:3',5'-cyclic-AMP phosphodiesterase
MLQMSSLQVVQISDTHLFANPNQQLLELTTLDSFTAVLKSLHQLQLNPDLLLLTGDLSQDETQLSYEHLRNLVEPLSIPTYWLPGNHDQYPLMEETLNGGCISTQKVFQRGGWNFILLNSMMPGQVYGELSADSLNGLDQQLANFPNHPTLIALHHPPCSIGSNWMDRINLRNSSALFEVIDRYKQVKLVLFGHIHQEFDNTRLGVRYLGCPSTCVQFKPNQQDFAIDQQSPGFRVLTLYPDGQYNTVIKRVNYQPLPNLTATGY